MHFFVDIIGSFLFIYLLIDGKVMCIYSIVAWPHLQWFELTANLCMFLGHAVNKREQCDLCIICASLITRIKAT